MTQGADPVVNLYNLTYGRHEKMTVSMSQMRADLLKNQ